MQSFLAIVASPLCCPLCRTLALDRSTWSPQGGSPSGTCVAHFFKPVFLSGRPTSRLAASGWASVTTQFYGTRTWTS